MNVVLAMSGGVDSSYTALMLKEKGFNVSGVYMKLHGRPNYHEKNIENGQRVADFLGISYEVLDFTKEFNDAVFNPFIKTYEAGLTPNPCALCNKNIKLGALLDHAKSKNAKLATGHYAQIENGMLKKAIDLSKDQTYFLANVTKQSLEDVLFPLGDKFKKDIKEQALKIPMLKSISEQKESSEICFVTTNYTDVLKEHVEVNQKGFVKNTKGEIVGEHDGYMHYTIGKRRGFSVKGALTPHYVLKIDAKANEIIVGSKEELFVKEFELGNINAFCDFDELECKVKIRYNTKEVPCKLIKKEKKVLLEESVYALAKGQLAVFYQGDLVVASGFIV
ncbi:tRNA U34 2-thiouridylase [Campylobacter sp. RM5004]|uniref:tRNA 2-thiouridine(34) synthase MnmA n=1 Tax=Campylobacter sp. RM5004 TaxID=1660078 RepID=UPI001EFA370B|nr:tRNA 2-thiouridine(34) synthase MnmA [Campylobacter sp. RM5004]ULO01874.1 tRNA U34 2-thiouridylase [Campylobacter sp. RM5004]